jgi:hypothetical protein
MSVNPLLDYFNNSVAKPLVKTGSEACCATKSLGKRVYQAGSAIISGLGNFPFYGVAASFGNRYSSAFGSLVGGCEASSYFLFRIRNFEDLREKFFGVGSEPVVPLASEHEPELGQSPRVVGGDQPLLHPGALSSDDVKPKSSHCCSKWKSIAIKTGIAALGLAAQFPFMVLTYYANGQNLVYPALTGVCEASFTILSLLMSFKSGQKNTTDPELENKRHLFIRQIDRFLEELPSKYNDPSFVQKIEGIFSASPPRTEEERGQALLHLVIEAKGLPELRIGAWDGTFKKIAKGLGLFISLYLTTVNGAVSYKGVKTWKDDQEALAILTTVFVSLANIKFLGKLCMDSAVSYYEGLRNILKKQYRPPLAHAVSPVAFYIGRAISTQVSWLSFGTTGLGARDYIPKVGKALIAPAPISSALILTENLNWTGDEFLLWAMSKCDSKVNKFNYISKGLSKFKEIIANSDPQSLQRFLEGIPNLSEPVLSDQRTPLLTPHRTYS